MTRRSASQIWSGESLIFTDDQVLMNLASERPRRKPTGEGSTIATANVHWTSRTTVRHVGLQPWSV